MLVESVLQRSDAAPGTLPLPPESITAETLDDAPPDYRSFLVRIMAMQAYAERLGATELALWVARAPSYRHRKIVARILADEANHSYWLYRELDAIGVSEAEAIDIAEGRTGAGAAAASLAGPAEVAAEQNQWVDVILNHMFLDRAGKFMVGNFAQSSYAPWAHVCRRILVDEALHEGFGYRELRRMIRDGYDREDLSRRVTRWFALGLNFFGPPRSSKTERLRELGLKRRSNEELRTAYRAEVMQLMDRLGARDLIRLAHDAFPYA
jgi:1,2-phenylacetyl-CoA epoxidase catalytic subunit